MGPFRIVGPYLAILAICTCMPKYTLAQNVVTIEPPVPRVSQQKSSLNPRKSPLTTYVGITKDITIGDYFDYMDSLVGRYKSMVTYPLSEHLLVHANKWVMDTLANTDYYRTMAKDSFVYDQRKSLVFREGDSLLLPDSVSGQRIHKGLGQLKIDVNIPEYKLRIYQDDSLLYTFSVRLGQNRKRFLKMSGRVTDLRTKTGNGYIVRHAKTPEFYNPVTCQRFHLTKRDDGRTTLMPQIPWIETEINGVRNGQMIHPTTNPKTLGKAYSNGCIGTREADAWIIYYHAPIGTPLRIRYDLLVKDERGKERILDDIYGYSN